MLIYYYEEDKGSKDKLPPLRTFLGSPQDRDSSLPKVQESLLGQKKEVMKLVSKRLALVVVLLGINVMAFGQQTNGFIWRQPGPMEHWNFPTYQHPRTQTFADSFLNSFRAGSQIRYNKELLKMEQESVRLSQELMSFEIERQSRELDLMINEEESPLSIPNPVISTTPVISIGECVESLSKTSYFQTLTDDGQARSIRDSCIK